VKQRPPARRDQADRPRAGHDQVAVRRERVGIEAAAADDEPLGAAQVGGVDAAAVRRERERVWAEGDLAAVAWVEAARAPDDPAAEEQNEGAGPRAPEAEVRAPPSSGATAVPGEPVPRQPHYGPVRLELEAAAAVPKHDRGRHARPARDRRPAGVGEGAGGRERRDHRRKYGHELSASPAQKAHRPGVTSDR
jgi:hypothetical protein